jgi:hypothetical protein
MAVAVIFAGAHDERDLLREALTRGLGDSVPGLVAHGLAPNLEQLPDELAARVVGLFAGMPIPTSVSALLGHLHESPDTARDQLARAGVLHPLRLRWAALLTRGYLGPWRNHRSR